MSNGEIQPGSIVQLKSGGPNMTVTAIDPADEYGPAQARCAWFDQKKECNGSFPLPALDKVA